MNREQAKEQAMVWLDIAKKVIGRKDTQTCLMYAQVYATLATVDEPVENKPIHLTDASRPAAQRRAVESNSIKEDIANKLVDAGMFFNEAMDWLDEMIEQKLLEAE